MVCAFCSFRTAPTTMTMWGACGQKRAGTRRACRADVQQRYRTDGAGRRGQTPFLNVSDAGVPVGEERFSIPAEEQNAGRVVGYFYRMEFHITPRFFSDSNYLFFVRLAFSVQSSPFPPCSTRRAKCAPIVKMLRERTLFCQCFAAYYNRGVLSRKKHFF